MTVLFLCFPFFTVLIFPAFVFCIDKDKEEIRKSSIVEQSIRNTHGTFMTFAVAEYYIISRPSEAKAKSESFASLANYLIKAYASLTTTPRTAWKLFSIKCGAPRREKSFLRFEASLFFAFLTSSWVRLCSTVLSLWFLSCSLSSWKKMTTGETASGG